ncbi:hypothetical protein MMC28_004966 [Mycoblastus sanguinarius]|nr:hypothetical protein [Mycoblastus sanguinarius]
MRYSVIAAPLALAAGVSAGNGTIAYTTEIVSTLTTYCPGATTLSHAGSTYVVTKATTLTITNCPCTLTKPVSSAPAVTPSTLGTAPAISVTPVASVPVAATTAPVVGTAPASISASPIVYSSVASPIYANSSVPAVVPAGTGTAAPTSAVTPSPSTTAPFKGAANKMAASGASLAALLGLAAYLL